MKYNIEEHSLTASLDDLKTKLPIPFVLDYYECRPHSRSNGRFHYINPWRDDNDPSLDVFVNDQGVQRWGDFATQEQGSVVDLIQKFDDDCSTSVAVGKARTLYTMYLQSDWEEGDILLGEGDQQGISREDIELLMEAGKKELQWHEVVQNLVSSKAAIDFDTLRGWELSVLGDTLQIPYPDHLALKYRHLDGSKSAAAGSKLSLYHKPGIDLDDGRPILLVEGETDCWAATAYAPHMNVVSVPGVGSQPMKIGKRLAGSDVTIFFDGDDAGRNGAEMWEVWLRTTGGTGSIVPTPEHMDIADMTQAEFDFFLSQRRSTVINTSDLRKLSNGYGREAKKEGADDTYVSPWTLDVTAVLDDAGVGRSYEGDLVISGRASEKVVLSTVDMAGNASIHRWATKHGTSWFGVAADHAKLRNLIDSEANTALVLPSTNKPGLVGTTFTYPGGYVGNLEVRTYESGDSPLSKPSAFHIPMVSKAQARYTLVQLLQAHRAEFVVPVLAWYAIAPLRSKYRQFPQVSVSGKAGSGKTTFTAYMQEKFAGSKFSTALTSTTEYGVSGVVGSSNAYPLWFDEYRPGASDKAIARLDQHLRDAYTGTPSIRGGLNRDNFNEVGEIDTMSPIIMSGEDYADETSHRDRLVKIFLDTDGMGGLPDGQPLARNYLEFLTTPGQFGRSPVETPPEVIPYQMDGLGITNRQAWNLGILQAGYGLLVDYAEYLGVSHHLPGLDLSHILSQMVEDSLTDQVSEALTAVYESKENNDNNAISIEDGKTYIHTQSFVQAAKRLDILLPFKYNATPASKYLTANNGGVGVTRTRFGTQRREIELPYDIQEA